MLKALQAEDDACRAGADLRMNRNALRLQFRRMIEQQFPTIELGVRLIDAKDNRPAAASGNVADPVNFGMGHFGDFAVHPPRNELEHARAQFPHFSGNRLELFQCFVELAGRGIQLRSFHGRK